MYEGYEGLCTGWGGLEDRSGDSISNLNGCFVFFVLFFFLLTKSVINFALGATFDTQAINVKLSVQKQPHYITVIISNLEHGDKMLFFLAVWGSK